MTDIISQLKDMIEDTEKRMFGWLNCNIKDKTQSDRIALGEARKLFKLKQAYQKLKITEDISVIELRKICNESTEENDK